ncbi:MAG TPA: hypothetical protein VGD56_08570 [Gemmatirosa sp.]
MARARALTNLRAADAALAFAIVLAPVLLTHSLAAQGVSSSVLRPTVAASAVFDAHPIGLVSAGIETDAGLYARLGLSAAGGASTASGARAVGELSATGRFLLDPLRQSARGIYATGGLALRVQQATRPRALVLAGLGLEGRPLGRVMPAIEAGLGGGARVSVVLRPVRPARR